MDTNTIVIIINGVQQSGKDTFVEFITNYCDMYECANVLNLSSVDPIKRTLESFGWNGDKSEEVRNIIAGIKKIWSDAQNGPTMFMMNNILQYHITHTGEDNIVFCHIREPEEIKKLSDIINGMHVVGIKLVSIFINRSGSIDMNSRKSDNYEDISKYEYDVILHNNGALVDWKCKAEEFIKGVIKEDMNNEGSN